MKYARIFAVHFEDAFAQRAKSFVFFLMSFINPLVALLFWQGAFQKNSVIGGWTQPEIQSYYLLLMVSQALLIAHVEYPVAYYDIKEGNIASQLLKPERYIVLKFFLEVPWRLTQGAFAIIAILLITSFAARPLTVAPDMVVLALISAFLGFFVGFVFKMMLGILGFFITDISAILELNDMTLLMLSGILMPVELMPKWAAAISAFTPFPYIVYWPIAIILGKADMSRALESMMIQITWIIGLYILYKILWKYGVRKYSGVGQ